MKKNRKPGEMPPLDIDIDAFIGEGTYFEGKLTFRGVVRIDGEVKGELKCDGTLIVGEAGVVNATISTRDAVIRGKVSGDVRADGRLELKHPCSITGNITAPVLVVDEGVSINGKVVTGNALQGDVPGPEEIVES
jgi:cytoskeletal protein CcmA (bactofilin family)